MSLLKMRCELNPGDIYLFSAIRTVPKNCDVSKGKFRGIVGELQTKNDIPDSLKSSKMD